jgi:hypothetical protein
LPEADVNVDAIDLAEARSACTCEACGEPGRLNGSGWLVTRCAEYAAGRRLIETRPGFENNSSWSGSSETGATFGAGATTGRLTPSGR